MDRIAAVIADLNMPESTRDALREMEDLVREMVYRGAMNEAEAAGWLHSTAAIAVGSEHIATPDGLVVHEAEKIVRDADA